MFLYLQKNCPPNNSFSRGNSSMEQLYVLEEGSPCIPGFTISSRENIIYSKQLLVLEQYQEEHLTLNALLRERQPLAEFKGIYDELNFALQNSPILRVPVRLYRGLSCKLTVQPGDQLENLGFMWATLDLSIAARFCRDTSSYYHSEKNFWEAPPSNIDEGTLLIITVPPEKHFLEVSSIMERGDLWSEFILPSSATLSINRTYGRVIEATLN